MAFLLYGKDELLAAWAAKKIPHIGKAECFGKYVAIGVATGQTAQDKLMAVCVFHEYIPQYGTVQISMAARDPRWASKATIRDLLATPFLQYKANKVFTATPHTLERVIRFNQAIGFTKEGVLRDQFGKGVHAVVCGMLWREYRKRYLPNWNDGRAAIMTESVAHG
jgi:RimJ/RimL family protein N-acetyltransferase